MSNVNVKQREDDIHINLNDPELMIKKSMCDICTPGPQCGLDVYVKDNTILKIEGSAGYPGSNGKLCTKGAANRQFVYKENRIRTPLRRVGERGSGQYEPISWEEAYQTIADNLYKIRDEFGPESTMFFCGYPKWLRPWLHRLSYSFGSPNFGTESSSCFQATVVAWKTLVGQQYTFDMSKCNVYMGWGCNSYMSNHNHARALMALKKRGCKIIIVDPRVTQTTDKLADIHLQIKPGTDGALALGMANVMIENNWHNQEFIDKHVHGFELFKEHVKQYTLTKTSEITGINEDDIVKITKIYATEGPVAFHDTSATINHHINGSNNYRAMISLQVLAGYIDCAGGSIPMNITFIYHDAGFDMMQEHFIDNQKPQNMKPRIGVKRFPLWGHFVDQFQAMDMVRAINENDPYPVKAILSFGLNNRMFPEPKKILEALKKLDFVVMTDVVMSDACKIADIVLPACTSLERSELKAYPGGFLNCTTPAITPLYQSKSDTEIICELASYLDIDDDLLKSGYENTLRYLISNLSVSLEELKAAETPLKMAEFKPYQEGIHRKEGFPTPTGKIELYSTVLGELQKQDPIFSPLPEYKPSTRKPQTEYQPFTLILGARLSNAIHSRFHDIPWARSLRPKASADIHPEDAKKLNLKEGDPIRITTDTAHIDVIAHLTYTSRQGDIHMYHGYPEADANDLISNDYLDPYTGFPGYRQLNCAIERLGGA